MQARASELPRPHRVLVVDDDDRVRRLCARSLRVEGFEVLEASSGEEAIEMMSRQPERIDVVITDIVMPDLNGIELVGRLRETRPDLPVILMSGYAPSELLRRDAYVTGFPLLRKPFTVDELYRAVRDALGT